MTESPPISVLCVDDNQHLADALKTKFTRDPGFSWCGWLSSADDLVETVQRERPALVLLDLDMPGKDPFEALAEIAECCPESRGVILSGHVNQNLVDKAIEAGAWGYISKSEDEAVLRQVLEQVMLGEFSLSPLVRAAIGE